jgi:hypothetical protein
MAHPITERTKLGQVPDQPLRHCVTNRKVADLSNSWSLRGMVSRQRLGGLGGGGIDIILRLGHDAQCSSFGVSAV